MSTDPVPGSRRPSRRERRAGLARLLLVGEVEQFLHREARLLDERRWSEWLDLWAPDATLSVPTRSSTVTGTDPVREPEPGPADLQWFEEPLSVLAQRVQKLESGWAWSEVPPSYTRRMVSNVEVDPLPGSDVIVRSNVVVYRQRGAGPPTIWAGQRRDRLRRTGGQTTIAQRTVILDVGTLPFPDLPLLM